MTIYWDKSELEAAVGGALERAKWLFIQAPYNYSWFFIIPKDPLRGTHSDE